MGQCLGVDFIAEQFTLQVNPDNLSQVSFTDRLVEFRSGTTIR